MGEAERTLEERLEDIRAKQNKHSRPPKCSRCGDSGLVPLTATLSGAERYAPCNCAAAPPWAGQQPAPVEDARLPYKDPD